MKKTMILTLSTTLLLLAAPTWAEALAAGQPVKPAPSKPTAQQTQAPAATAIDSVTKQAIEKAKQVMPDLREFAVKDIWKGRQIARVRFTKPKSAVTATLFFNWVTGDVLGCSFTDPNLVHGAKNPLSDKDATQRANQFVQKLQAISKIDPSQMKQEKIDRSFADIITISYASAGQESTDYLRLEMDPKGQIVNFGKLGITLIEQLSVSDFDDVAKKAMEKTAAILPGFKSASVEYVLRGLNEFDPFDTWKIQASAQIANGQKVMYVLQFNSQTGEIYDIYQGVQQSSSNKVLTSVQATAAGKKLLEQFYGEEAQTYTVKQVEQNTKNPNPNMAYTVIVYEEASLHKKVSIRLNNDGHLLQLEKQVPRQ